MKLYPKPAYEIMLTCVGSDAEPRTMSLEVKLAKYLYHFGQANPCFMTIFMELLSHGKVRVDLGSYAERLELVNPADKLTSAQAANLLYDFSATAFKQKESQKKRATAQISVPSRATRKPAESDRGTLSEGDRVLLRGTEIMGEITTVFRHHSGMPAYFVRWDPHPNVPAEGETYFATDLTLVKTEKTAILKPGSLFPFT